MTVPPIPVRVPSQRPLAPRVTSVTNDKGGNEIIPGAVHRCPSSCLMAEVNPGKPQLGDRLLKGLCDYSSPQMGVPYLEINSICSHSTSGRAKEGKKECGLFGT